MKLHPACASLLAAAALWTSGAVHAAANKVSAEITNFKIELIDLRPDDGIVPSVTFSDPSFYSNNTYTRSGGYYESKDLYYPGSTVIGRSFGATAGWSTPDTLGSNAQVWTIENLEESLFWSASSRSIGWHSLPQDTILRISGTVALNITKTGQSEETRASGGRSVRTGLEASNPDRIYDYFEIYNGALTENFSVDFSGPAQTWGHIGLSTYSRTQATAVPEPATYGMLLAGLGIVGLRRHGRRKNK